MKEEEKSNAQLQELSYDFTCRIARLFQYLTENSEYKEYIFSKQIVRWGSSVGANIREGQHAQSDADFISKLSIAQKEQDETQYRLSLLHDNRYINDRIYESLKHGCSRIGKLLTVILKKMKQKINNK